MQKIFFSLRGTNKIFNQSRTLHSFAQCQQFTNIPQTFFMLPFQTSKNLPSQRKQNPIIDPSLIYKNIEKLDPSPINVITLPTTHVKRIKDPVNDKHELHLMPKLVTIRRKKMKKHKRRKLRRKLLFVKRKFRHAQAKIKEKKIVDYEMKQRRWGEAYDAEVDMRGTLDKARRAGWGIDIIAEYRASKR